MQVITLTGLLAQLPAAVFDDLLTTEVAVSADARTRTDCAFAARLGELATQRAAHKFALRPAAARPAMAAAFEELKEKVTLFDRVFHEPILALMKAHDATSMVTSSLLAKLCTCSYGHS